jgi:arylsulfatase A-like enzyme
VLDNVPGYPNLHSKADILPAWLQRAGYRTAHIGKYLNNTARRHPNGPPPSGWNRWSVTLEPNTYYRYSLQFGDREKEYGRGRHDYLTSVLNRQTTRLIDRWGRRATPFFIELDQYAPHKDRGLPGGRCREAAVPAPRDDDLFRHAEMPRPPSFNEPDNTDKPSFMQLYDSLNHKAVRKVTDRYRCALATLREVDRGVERIYQALKRTGVLDNTLILLTSDNGFYYGEHRIPSGKETPYEEGIHMPLLMRPPKRGLSGHPPSRIDQLTANIDIAPTILDLTGVHPCREGCRTMDGRSMVPLLEGRSDAWPKDRGVAIEFSSSRKGRPIASRPCKFVGIRTPKDIFVDYLKLSNPLSGRCVRSDQAEYYALRDDPNELENRYPGTSVDQIRRETELARRLSKLRHCSGIEGRDGGGGPHCE